jgi:hypothetical protein
MPITEVSLYLSRIGRLGGRASRDAKTPEQRSANAKKASLARWGAKSKPASKTKQTGGKA